MCASKTRQKIMYFSLAKDETPDWKASFIICPLMVEIAAQNALFSEKEVKLNPEVFSALISAFN